MSTHTQIIYQIVYSTKHRENTLIKKNREQLFRYMDGIIKNKNCRTFQINGVENHLHILMKMHPTICLSDFIKEMKISTHNMIKDKNLFPLFTGWQGGYGAFTYSNEALPNLIRYIKNQELHHGEVSFEDEYIGLLDEHGIEYDPRYVFD